uniref:Uncharacterized protein n=1 Tax=Rousettus aegyptiacus TaxID=9407 RepID=A0A7J8BF89_ROUAE|nr:hypothetical protein HJG63_009833 [Rousettus aegyptiacus]
MMGYQSRTHSLDGILSDSLARASTRVGRILKAIRPGMLKNLVPILLLKKLPQSSVVALEKLNPLLTGFLERRSKVNGSTKLSLSQLGSRRVFLFYSLWKPLFASSAYGFCHELKIGTTCSLESVKAETNDFNMSSKAVSHGAPPAVILLIYRRDW